jgi:hypothetical protein
MQSGRDSYIDYIQVDQRPPLVTSTSAADSIFGPVEDSVKGDGISWRYRAQLEKLAETFAPMLILPRGDFVERDGQRFQLIPTDVHAFADTLRLDVIQVAPFGMHDWEDIHFSGLDADSLARLVDSMSEYEADPNQIATWYFDFPGQTPREWWHAYWQFRAGPDSAIWAQPTTYAHPFLDASGRMVIQYWYFYPFNDYIGNHEGDWEHVNVVLTEDLSGIEQVHYYFHHRSLSLPQGDSKPRIVDQTHPIVYVGGRAYNILDYPIRIFSGDQNEGSHAAFPYPGEWESAAGLGSPESVNDADNDSSTVLHYSDIKVMLTPEPSRIDYSRNREILKEWGWLLLPVRWGFPTAPSLGAGIKFADIGNTAPFGPAFNAGWNRTAPGYLYPAYTVYRVPTGRAIFEDIVQPWYWPYIFRSPRYVNDSRGTVQRKELERLGLVPQGGWREIGTGGTLLGLHVGFPMGDFSDSYGTSTGLLIWRGLWAKLRFGAVEFMGGYQKFSRNSPPDGSLFIYPITINLVARMPDALFRPYATIGAGMYGWESRLGGLPGGAQLVTSGWNGGWTAGVGVEYYLRPGVALDVALRQNFTSISGDVTGRQADNLNFLLLWIGHYIRF